MREKRPTDCAMRPKKKLAGSPLVTTLHEKLQDEWFIETKCHRILSIRRSGRSPFLSPALDLIPAPHSEAAWHLGQLLRKNFDGNRCCCLHGRMTDVVRLAGGLECCILTGTICSNKRLNTVY